MVAYPAIVSLIDSDLKVDIDSLQDSWSIQLQKKSLLGSVSSVQTALYDMPEFFSGFVIGNPGSWVRLARDSADSTLTGHIYSNDTLFELQYREDIGGYAIARLADSASQLQQSIEAPSNKLSFNGRSSNNGPLPLAKAIRVGIVVDSRYNEQYNGRGLAHALGVMNGVDGLYQNQLGLAVVVESFRVYEDPDTDPLRKLNGSTDELLERYRDERLLDSELSKDLALVHLFSGFRDPLKVIGLGWISTACSFNGYDLSLSTPFPFDILLAAHEIAHNLGALHDDDAQCISDDGITGAEVMWSELSGSTRPTFSSCSVNAIRKTIDTGECVADDIDVSVALEAMPTAGSDQQAIQITVFNQDLARRANQVNSLTTFPLGTTLSNPSAGCLIQGATLSCQHDPIGAQQLSKLTANAMFNGIINPVITTDLNIELFMDTRHQDNRAALQIDSSSVMTNGSSPASSPASGDSRPGTLGEQADDESLAESDSGGSAGGINAGSASTFFLLILSFFATAPLFQCKSRNILAGS